MRLPHGNCIAELAPTPDYIACRLILDDVRDLTTAIARCRRLLDLDADPEAVDDHLGADPHLGRSSSRSIRVPAFVARSTNTKPRSASCSANKCRSAAARTHAGRLVAAYGDAAGHVHTWLTHTFPTVEALMAVDPIRS